MIVQQDCVTYKPVILMGEEKRCLESLIGCSYCHTLGLFKIKMSNKNLLSVAWSCCKVQQLNLSSTAAFGSGQKKVAIEKGGC